MWVSPTTTVEVELAGVGGGWTDISADLTEDPILQSWGIKTHLPNIRVASTGEIKFGLRNDANNSGPVQSWYSPFHASKRSGWGFGIRCRVKQVYSGTTRYKLGYVRGIQPEPGEYEGRRVFVSAVDWIDEAAKTNAPTAVQVNQRSDQVFSAVLANVAKQPAATSIGVGIDTFTYALDNVASETKALASFANLALSELGLVYLKRDATIGETLTFENRRARAAVTALLATLDKTMYELEVPGAASDILNRFLVTTFPRRIEAGIVIAKLEAAMATALLPGETRRFFLDYTDPAQRDTKIGATAQIAPVVTTDYTMNTAFDGTGADLSSSFAVTATFFSSSVMLDVTNNHASSSGYVRTLQCRGNGIFALNPVDAEGKDAASIATYGENLLQLPMLYQSNPLVGADAAHWMKSTWKDPLAHVRRVKFVANQSDALMTAAITGDISAKVALVETINGLTSATKYFINAVELDSSETERLLCTWWLTPADPFVYWQIGLAGFSELGTTTRLGY